MKYRSKLDIFDDILEAANESGGTVRTKIMYRAFLSHTQLKEYLQALSEKDLVRYDVDTHTFKTTKKGLEFLDTYNWLSNAIKAH
jgi:predicted transcriptional regulator